MNKGLLAKIDGKVDEILEDFVNFIGSLSTKKGFRVAASTTFLS
jgi:hypothetical protein